MFTVRNELLAIYVCYLLQGAYSCFVKRGTSGFRVYWNVPTEACHKYGINFTELCDYGLIQNKNDKFRGEQITILYDPGLFPAIIEDGNRNGGVPQEGNLNKHLEIFKNQLISTIPDSNFKGVGIVDFEHWRPIWRENWGNLDVYRRYSKEIERNMHPFWPSSKIEQTAESRFEKAAFRFMDETLRVAKQLRPGGVWGYYAYPYCFNFTPKNPVQSCTDNVKKDNDRSSWMYDTGTALYPSIYLREKELNENKRPKMIAGRLAEAKRIAHKQGNRKIKILPYFAVKYQDTFTFLSKVDMANGIKISQQSGAQGLILWGATKDTNSAKKCQQLMDYVSNVIRPILKRL